jgi:signal transduction histidine kinase
MLGGKVWVDSVPGEGATFFFRIPKAQRKARPDTP